MKYVTITLSVLLLVFYVVAFAMLFYFIVKSS